MLDRSPHSPEARRERFSGGKRLPWQDANGQTLRLAYVKEIAKRVLLGVYDDGFIHAGNLAYLSLVSLFPFFIVAATIASALGRTEDGVAAVHAFLQTVPHDVANVLRGPIESVIAARSSSGIVWLGVLVALWTTASLIETIRDILRRAYGTTGGLPFWQYRLRSIGLIVASVFLTMLAFSAQIVLAGASEFLTRLLPFADDAINIVSTTKMVPLVLLTLTLFILYRSLTPHGYRTKQFPKLPGAVLTALWWYGTLLLLPWVLAHFASYDMTYGSLAGVMITLIFFFLVGLGVVIGAELNAALAEFPPEDMQELPEIENAMQGNENG
ncbi:MAG: YihY/virulence factor BrkB family protein [Sphingobium sp.]|nr:YihY/virulence factor BrkB family protein [Sphingobium sp.]